MVLYTYQTLKITLKKKFLSNETGFYLMPEKRSIDIDYKSDYIKVKRVYANV